MSMCIDRLYADYRQIQPSRQLAYHRCYDGFLCARLDAPLDWNSTGSQQQEKRVAVAVIKLPAKVSVANDKYGGAILMNPGLLTSISQRPSTEQD